LSQLDAVEYVAPVTIFEITLLYSPNDPYWSSEQSYLHQSAIDLEGALDFIMSNDTVAIYFCDDGVADHEDWPQPFSILGYN
jgi:hypothetical protein